MILMSTVTIAVIVVAVLVAGALVIGAIALVRRRRLQQRFGPEYDRLVGESDSKRKAESELAGRQRRVHGLDIRPLTASARAGYAHQWAGIQEQFVDTPADAVASSQVLVAAVMSELGYPAEDPDQVLADLSVEHASVLDQFRAAEETSKSAASGTASTEDLRLAMIGYRALFRELLGDPDDAPTPSVSGPARASETDPAATEESDAHIHDTQPDLYTGDPVTKGPDQRHSRMTEGELTR